MNEIQDLLIRLWHREISADDVADELCYNGPQVDEFEETLRKVWRREISADDGYDALLEVEPNLETLLPV